MYWEFPTADEFAEKYKKFPFERLKVPYKMFDIPSTDVFRSMQNVNIRDWVRVFNNRVFGVAYSFVLASFYLDKGIPDDKWHTDRMEYFPDFEEEHHFNKVTFDYYADNCFYKMFSLLDTLGHLLFLRFELTPKNERDISIASAILKLRDANPILHVNLHNIQRSKEYKTANKYRNDYTHNFPVGEVGPGIHIQPNRIDIGIGTYTTSKQVHASMQDMLECVKKMISAVKESLISD